MIVFSLKDKVSFISELSNYLKIVLLWLYRNNNTNINIFLNFLK